MDKSYDSLSHCLAKFRSLPKPTDQFLIWFNGGIANHAGLCICMCMTRYFTYGMRLLADIQARLEAAEVACLGSKCVISKEQVKKKSKTIVFPLFCIVSDPARASKSTRIEATAMCHGYSTLWKHHNSIIHVCSKRSCKHSFVELYDVCPKACFEANSTCQTESNWTSRSP